MNITFDKKIVTAALGITAKELEYLIEDSILPMGEFGEYDISACIEAYSQYRINKAKATHDLPVDLVHMDEVIFEMQDKIIKCRTLMLEIPQRVAGLCARLKDASAIERFIGELIEEALAELTPLNCTKYMR